MKNYTIIAIAFLALTSRSSHAVIGYRGGYWSSKVVFEVKARVTQCTPKVTTDCKKCCIGGGKSDTQKSTKGTKATISANVTGEVNAGVSGSVWKFAKVEAGFKASTTVSGAYEINTVEETSATGSLGANECGTGLGLDEQKTKRWTENYTALRQIKFSRTKQEETHTPVSTTRPCGWGGSLPTDFKSGTIGADGVIQTTTW